MLTLHFYMFPEHLPNVGEELTSQQKREHSGMAGEYYVLSCLHRRGKDAYLTIGNHKSIDILVRTTNGSLITIDAKAIDEEPFPIQNACSKENHFYALLHFGHKKGGFWDLEVNPDIYIVPSWKIRELADEHHKNIYVKHVSGYKNRWDLLDEALDGQ